MSGYFIDPTSGGTMPNNLELAQKKLNDIRQLVTTVSERPAAKTSGERATLIAYRETTWLKRQLGELAELLKLVRANEMEPTNPENFARPLGASPFVDPHNLDEVMREGPKGGGGLYRCSCGAEFTTMSEAVTHAVNGRRESAEKLNRSIKGE